MKSIQKGAKASTQKVEVTVSTLAFACAEFMEIHKLCDLASVPAKSTDGESFTVAQRVRIMATVLEHYRLLTAKQHGEERVLS